MLDRNNLVQLAKTVAKADPSAPVSYSFNGEQFSYAALNETLRRELASLWKDVKVEVAPSAQIRRIKNSVAYDRDKRNNVDDI